MTKEPPETKRIFVFYQPKKTKGALAPQTDWHLIACVLIILITGSVLPARKKTKNPDHTNLVVKLPFFTGRQKELYSLEKNFLSKSPSPLDTTVHLICGLGGMGKTELARAFAHLHKEEFSIIWFINCATGEQKNQNYRELAEELKIPIFDKEPPEQIAQKVHAYLKKHPYSSPWLIVYDNLKKEIELPQGGYVLITSCDVDVWKNPKERTELFEFTPEESLKILKEITEKNSPKMGELAEALGHFPLALNQAAHYIRNSGSVEEYLAALRKNPIHGKISPSERYTKILQNVWDITLERLAKQHPKACAWLQVCAHLNPDDIPQKWLDVWLKQHPGDERDKMEITKILGDLSLIRTKDEGHSMHRLVQYAVREASSGSAFREALDLVNMQRPVDGGEWQKAEQWVSQALYVITSIYFAALDQGEQAKEYDSFVSILRALGHYQQALEYGQKALKIKEDTLPPLHLDVAKSYNNIGLNLGFLGHHQESLEYKQKALRIREDILPPLHPDLAQSYSGIGVSLWLLGRNQEALEYAQKALTIEEEILPPLHPNLAKSYDGIGTSLAKLGRHEEALVQGQKALRIREEVLPALHPDLADSYNNVGLTLWSLGYRQESLDHARKALKIREAILPPLHPRLAQSYSNISISLGDLGLLQEALEYAQKSLTIREKVLPPLHPSLAQSYNNIGIRLEDLGRHQEALEYAQKSLTIREKVLPPQHPDLAKSYNNIGLSLISLKRHQEAVEYTQKALTIREKILSPLHPDLALSYDNIGVGLRGLGRHQEALEFAQKSLAIRERVLSPSHPDIARSYDNLGLILEDLERHQEAVQHSQSALEHCALQKNCLSQEKYLKNFICILKQQNDRQIIEKAKQEILALYIPRLGENHQLIQELKRVQPMNSTCTIF